MLDEGQIEDSVSSNSLGYLQMCYTCEYVEVCFIVPRMCPNAEAYILMMEIQHKCTRIDHSIRLVQM